MSLLEPDEENKTFFQRMKGMPPIKLLILVLSSGLLGTGANHILHEQSLQTALLANYSKHVRPDTSVQVYITMVPLSLNSLDISQQYMSFTAVYVMNWHDSRLTWTPSVYGNLSNFVIPPEQLWTPPIVVENAVTRVGKIGGENKDDTPLRVRSDGEVLWYPPLETTTSCEMKISRYPFDTQACFITLTGWGFSSQEIVLTNRPLNMQYYSVNGEWDLMDYWTTNGTFYDGVDYFTRLNIHFSLRRKWQFYSQNLILPIVLTSILMCCVFALPLDCGEKMGYTLTVLLSYVVFLTWVTDNLPSVSNDTSVLQVYLACVLCLGILATLLTCWVVHMHHRQASYPMSATMRVFVAHCLLPLWGCTCCETKRQNLGQVRPMPVKSETNKAVFAANDTNNGSDHNEGDDDDSMRKRPLPEDTPETESGGSGDKPAWQEVAAMFDNLFLILYVVAMSSLSVTVLVLLYVGY